MSAKGKKVMSKSTEVFGGDRIALSPKRDSTVSGRYMVREIVRRQADTEWSYLEAGCKTTLPAQSAIEVLEEAGVEGRWNGRRFDLHSDCEVTGPLIYRKVGFLGAVGRIPLELVTLARYPEAWVVLVVCLAGLVVGAVGDDWHWRWVAVVPGLLLSLALWAANLDRHLERTSWGLRFPGTGCIAGKVGQTKS